jgi:predicted glycosyltransferase involved in capsule biosynthesis
MLTVIVPLRLPPKPRPALRRLARLLGSLPPDWGVIVVDDTADLARRTAVAELVSGRPRARHLPHPETAADPFSIGRLRDAGAEAAPPGLVMFHDVDFFAPPGVYRRLERILARAELMAAPGAFVCVPVAFLTRVGSRLVGLAPDRLWPALARRSGVRTGLVDRLTAASSAMVMDRATLLLAGGHDRRFVGHGAEDFELMHRLATLRPLGPRPANYSTDFGSRGQGEDGFRAYFARAAASPLAEGLHLAHEWHPPRREDVRYYAARRANFSALAKELGGT